MAKVNLLTIHYGRCYGAVMQTFATCKMLEEAGHEVTVINIIHPKLKKFFTTFNNIKQIVKEYQFYRFKRKYFSKMSTKTYSINNQKLPKADYTVVGSDQVWNRDITGTFDYAFYLDFVPNYQKRIALCSSFGKAEWNEDNDYTNSLKKEFEKFDAISIREKSGVDIMKRIFNIEAINLQDPTLCYGKFGGLILDKKEKNIVFPFLLNKSNEAKAKVKFISDELNIPIYKETRINTYLQSGPRHWLTNIYNCKYVITDSFHGLALSILYKKEFFVFCADPNKFTRLQSLLELIGLQNRIINTSNYFKTHKEDLLKPIDYEKVYQIIKKEQDKAKQFIFDNIK